MEDIYDVIILGAGAAGLSAGIYSSRGKLKTLILNQGAVGGQMVLTNEVANYPGVEMTKGYSLANIMKKQAKGFGCKIKGNVKIVRYQLDSQIKEIELENGTIFYGKSVILAPGGKPRTIGAPGEDIYKGSGISFCATCDADFFQDKELVVIGGGNSALEEAVTLSNFASKVTIIHQFDNFQAFKHAIEDMKNNPKINYILESEVREFKGDGENLNAVVVEHLPTGKRTELKTDGVFMFIGYLPNTEEFKDLVELNDRGEIVVDKDMKTNVPGVFAAGDCIAKKYRQVTLATAEGTIAALGVLEYLRE
jgi:thioredoxin reductase (NADPH)